MELSGNVRIVNFLDITLNLNQGTVEPFMKKKNGEPIHVNVKSNHPIAVIKQIPKSINNRLNRNSSNLDIFNKYKPVYEVALKNSGYINSKFEYSNEYQDKNDHCNNDISNSNYDDDNNGNNGDNRNNCSNNNTKKTHKKRRNRMVYTTI